MKRYTYAGFIIPLLFSTILLISAFILLFSYFGWDNSRHSKTLHSIGKKIGAYWKLCELSFLKNRNHYSKFDHNTKNNSGIGWASAYYNCGDYAGVYHCCHK